VTIRKISPTLMQAVMKCLDNPPRGMLGGWLRPSKDDLTFTLTLKYNPVADDQPCKIKSVAFLSSTSGKFSPLDESQEKIVKPGERVPIVGVSLAFQRQKLTESITVVVNTDKGSKILEIPSVDPDEIIDRLTRKVSELEARIEKLSKPMFASGSWSFDHNDCDKTDMISNVPETNGKGSSSPSRYIEFKFPKGLFSEPPEIHVSIYQLVTDQTKMKAEVTEVTADGFKLRAVPIGTGFTWCHLDLTWIAIPKQMTTQVVAERPK
jgi:hypothetical protein